jgi:hypothetical protein
VRLIHLGTRLGTWFGRALVASFLIALWAPVSAAFPGGGLGPAVGIKVTVTDTRPEVLEADMDLTWYTRVGPYASTTAGFPLIGYPALDYGDGSTLSYTTLALASSGGGPGGSNVYRNLASFTHTYPAFGSYTVTGASFCTACYRSQYVFFPAGSPAPTTFSYSYDYVPQTVVGNLRATVNYSGTVNLGDITEVFSDTSVRYMFTAYLAVTNTAQVAFSVLEVPTASTWSLLALGVLLAVTGLVLLRRL